ncbi:MAG TPA: hypothetical protein VHF22_00235 [Planctomycetota bacterium]|nr:hypothetical protein [Planctomycetota bacterium]
MGEAFGRHDRRRRFELELVRFRDAFPVLPGADLRDDLLREPRISS